MACKAVIWRGKSCPRVDTAYVRTCIGTHVQISKNGCWVNATKEQMLHLRQDEEYSLNFPSVFKAASYFREHGLLRLKLRLFLPAATKRMLCLPHSLNRLYLRCLPSWWNSASIWNIKKNDWCKYLLWCVRVPTIHSISNPIRQKIMGRSFWALITSRVPLSYGSRRTYLHIHSTLGH